LVAKRFSSKRWEALEENIMKAAIYIFLVITISIIFFIQPFVEKTGSDATSSVYIAVFFTISVIIAIIFLLVSKPKPKLEFRLDKGLVKCYSLDDPGWACYLRLAIRNKGKEKLTGCYGIIISVEKDGRVYDQESKRLPFAPAHEIDALNRTIQRESKLCMYMYMDVFRFEVKTNKVDIATQIYPTPLCDENKTPLFQSAGKCIINIMVCGDEFDPIEKKINFEWRGGNYQNCEYSILEK
jgi:hypothetical protein